jgi:hypothetical protein
VNDVRVFSLGEQKPAYIAGLERYGGVRCQMRAFLGEDFRVTRQYGGLRPEAESMVYKTKALNQPATEKASTARYEQTLAAQFVPQSLGVSGD